MPLSGQPQQIIVPPWDLDGNGHVRYNWRVPGRPGYQVQHIAEAAPCAQNWDDIFTMDLRFVGDLTVDHMRQRAIVTMHSASAEPACVVTGADVNVLASWESNTPANFGGDGHQWWKVCYVSPNQDSLNFSGVSGSHRFATWFTCEGDLPVGSGNHGDGVAIIHVDNLEYTATFGTAHAEVSVSQAALAKDALFLWVDGEFRSIDDITQQKYFHAADSSQFDHDYSRFNSDFVPMQPGGGAASSIDWHIAAHPGSNTLMTYTMGLEVDAVAAVFPGACRVVATAFGADLRALCE